MFVYPYQLLFFLPFPLNLIPVSILILLLESPRLVVLIHIFQILVLSGIVEQIYA